MAQAVAVDTWSADGVRLSDVVSALAVLRHQSSERSSARTAVMTLVAVATTDEQAYSATNAVRALGGHHPARIVIIRPDPYEVAALDARATLYALQLHGTHVNFEEVTLGVRGQAAFHLDSIVEAFTLSDLPVVVWYVGSIPDPIDPLLTVATAVLLDSRDASGEGQFRTLLELARRRTVVDLSWIRLAPWRELLAGMFDPADCREWLGSIDSIEVVGKLGPRLLLGGWLTSRLTVSPGQVALRDGRHVAVRVEGRREGQTALFEVSRHDDGRQVAAQATLPSGPKASQTIGLSDEALPTALGGAFARLRADPTWERALSAATSLRP